MSLLDRLMGSEEPHLSAHLFYGALVGMGDGQLTRGQIEAGFDIEIVGSDKTELDFLINTFTGIVSDDFSAVGNVTIRTALEGLSVNIKREHYKGTLHAIFMLMEHDAFSDTFSKADIQTWLLASVA